MAKKNTPPTPAYDSIPMRNTAIDKIKSSQLFQTSSGGFTKPDEKFVSDAKMNTLTNVKEASGITYADEKYVAKPYEKRIVERGSEISVVDSKGNIKSSVNKNQKTAVDRMTQAYTRDSLSTMNSRNKSADFFNKLAKYEGPTKKK